MLVEEFHPLVGRDHHIPSVVHEDGLDGRHGGVCNFLEEGALLVTVGDDGGNLGSTDALDGRVGAGVLVHHGIVAGNKVLLCPGHQLLLRKGFGLTDLTHLLFPGEAVHEAVHHEAGTGLVAFQHAALGQAVVGDGRFEELLGEISAGDAVHLFPDNLFHFPEALPFLGGSLGQEDAPVGAGVGIDIGLQHALLLQDIEVDETGQAVIQDEAGDLGVLCILKGVAGGAPAHEDKLVFETEDIL